MTLPLQKPSDHSNDASNPRAILQKTRSLILKIGSGVLVRDGLHLDRGTFCRLIEQVAGLVAAGYQVSLVSSGAVALGRSKLGGERPDRQSALPKLQAMAAVGQTRLMHLYESELEHYGLHCGQILLTRDDMNDRSRYLNASRTLRELCRMGCIPIINENDTIASDEIRFGDNDQLAAHVACMLDVDLLVIFSDVDAVYTSDPRNDPNAAPLRELLSNDPRLAKIASGTPSKGVGTGGMVTKLKAAELAARRLIPTLIMSGKDPLLLPKALAGAPIGTLIMPPPGQSERRGRKIWIEGLQSRGQLHCDAGARSALRDGGKSFLPSGLKAVDGSFIEGDAVEILGPDGELIARGLAAYPAADMKRIAGKHSNRISEILGYQTTPAVIHRDDLVLVLPPQTEC